MEQSTQIQNPLAPPLLDDALNMPVEVNLPPAISKQRDRLESHLNTLADEVRDQFRDVLSKLEAGFRLPSLDNPSDLNKGYPLGVFSRYEGITFSDFRALLFNILTARTPIMPTAEIPHFLLSGLRQLAENPDGLDISAVDLDKELFRMGTLVDGKRGALGGY